MRKGVIWTGAIAGAVLGAGGWVFEFALSKAATFVYAVVVSLVANAVFDYVHAPAPPPHGTAAAARIGAVGKEAAKAPIRPAGIARQASAEAALPRRVRLALPPIISPVPIRPLAPLAPLPADTQTAARSAPAAVAPPVPGSQRTVSAAAPPANPPAPGPGSGGLY
ncbi:MAG TPA: hypothetical protein VE993_06525 [Stellaceae bacterium]|nr:hypothetical protein [Stellaceae bacterium]